MPDPAPPRSGRPAHLLHVFSTLKVGGPQVRFVQIANALADRFRHSLIAMDGRTDALAQLAAGVEHTLLPLPAGASLPGRLLAYRRLLRQIRPDRLITYNWGAIEWALANLSPLSPHIHIEDGFGPEESHRQLRRRVWTRRLALSGHSTVIVPSRTLHAIASKRWRLPRKRLIYVPNGVDCRRFAQPPDLDLVRRLGLPQDRPVIGTACALRPEKNLSRLIRAVHKVHARQPCHLVLIGEGGERDKLQALARKLEFDKSVTFAGHLYEPEKLIGALDIYAISSDTEQMPYGLLEAMAAGRPVAGVDVGDVRTIVAEENASLIVDKDTDALAQALATLCANAGLRKALGTANKAKAHEVYDQDRMIATYARLFSPAN